MTETIEELFCLGGYVFRVVLVVLVINYYSKFETDFTLIFFALMGVCYLIDFMLRLKKKQTLGELAK